MVTVAWITPFAPDRHGGGGQIRQAHLLLGLAPHAAIELISAGPVVDLAVRDAVVRLSEVSPVLAAWRPAHPWLRRAADLAASAGSRQPMEVRAFRPVRRALRPAMAGLRADVVLVEFAGLAPLLPRRRSGQWALTFHNLASRMASQQVAIMPRRRQRWLLGRDAATAAAFERRAVAAFDHVVACSDGDAAALAPPGRVVVVPNGVDTDSFQATPLPDRPRVVFTGALYTSPNVDGAEWLCHQVLPRLRARNPAIEVDVVGARPTDEVRALDRLAGVTVHPDVADVAPFLRAARAAVVPLRIGSGSRLKALEAMAAGRPVVGTTIGLEGLELQPGHDVLVADAPEAFAAAILRVLDDDELARSLATAGRATVEARYSWTNIAADFARSVVAMAETDVRPGVRG